MRRCLLGLVVLVACGADEATDDDGTSAASSGVDETSGGTPSDSSGLAETSGATTTSGGADGSTTTNPGDDTTTADPTGASTAPTITRITWEHAAGCQAPQVRELTVTVEVTDDSAIDDLAFGGSVSGCDGMLDASVGMVTCEGSSNHIGVVNVADPDGLSDEQAFNVVVCVDGMVEF
jgi:hypothetical protein